MRRMNKTLLRIADTLCELIRNQPGKEKKQHNSKKKKTNKSNRNTRKINRFNGKCLVV